jgi:hypothetical protein
MTELVMCRRGPERQAGAARPDLVNPVILPSAHAKRSPSGPVPLNAHAHAGLSAKQ